MTYHHEIPVVEADREPVLVEVPSGRLRRAPVVTPAQVVSAVGGFALLALGIFAIARTGLDAPLSDPVRDVLGLQHTAAIGLVELAIGTVLLVSALSPAARWLSALVGVGLVVADIVLLAGSSELLADLRTQPELGWIGIIVGGAVTLAALFSPRTVV